MPSHFDQIIDRRESSSTKWNRFSADVLPMWVADMDFAAPDFILDGLRERLNHPILGYTLIPESLTEAFQNWLRHHFAWHVPAEWIVWLPGVVPGLNLAAQTLPRGSGLMIPTPVYHPFFEVAEHAGLVEQQVKLGRDGSEWVMDFDAMQKQITPDTKMIAICNPQNPTGRAYTWAELNELAQFIERNDLILVCDEIHCNILLDEKAVHLPFAHAFPDLAARTVSLYSATKVYNIPGVSCAAAVIPDAGLRDAFQTARKGLLPGIGPLGFVASELAFNDRSTWISDLNGYLRQNLRRIESAVGNRLAHHDATYLAWIDVADLGLEDTEQYFAEHGLGINPGAQFGEPDFIRMNFGCPTATLDEGLARLSSALG